MGLNLGPGRHRHCLVNCMEATLQHKLEHFFDQHPKFQEKNLLKIRMEVSKEILHLDMPEERRTYLLHQLAYTHSVEELSDFLTQVMN